ncbi:MAG TPA: zf-HC2 domain-containing protein [Sedimentisphaerales bacterium]|nr:zf-HC2 domain-containing protein [Sedimentisphaerales bacterium]
MNCTECKELLVAYVEGLLDEPEKQTIAEHLKDCPVCQAESAEVRALRDRLVKNGKVLSDSRLEDEVLNRIIREQNVKLKTGAEASVGLRVRRIIMESRITRLAAAAVIIIAVLVGIHQIGGGTVTWAKVIEPILNARTVVYDFIVGDEESSPVMHEIVVGTRIRRTISNIPNMTSIIDLESAKILALDTEAKTATYIDIKGSLQEKTRGYIEFVRKVLMELKDSPNVKELGEREIDGQKAIGFSGRGPNDEVNIWADLKTAVPIRVELRIGQLLVVLKNFKFDVPIKDSQVSMEVPEGYTLEQTDVDFTGATEQDFIESLRIWAEVLLDGKFPEAIGTENTMKQVPLLGEKLAPLDLQDDEKRQLGMKFIRGMLFLQIYEYESQGKWSYTGKGVRLGDADKAIFWYRPEGSEAYRVIYGDLSVKEVSEENLPK